MRAALYARVSCRHIQGDNFSIETQLEAMRAHAASQRWTVVAEYEERESAYEDGLDRSELNKLLKFIRTQNTDVLIFFSSDRFTRDVADGVVLRRELYKLGIRLFCYHPYPQEIKSENELIHILNDWRNQQYIEGLREASMRSYGAKIAGGAYGQGTPPYGYRIEGEGRTANLVPIPEQAAIVQEVFHTYIQGAVTTVSIARMLSERGVPTPGNVLGRRSKRGYAEWSQGAVYKMLRDETYAGTWYGHRLKKVGKKKFIERPREEWVPVAVPPIVDRSVWEQAQQRLRERDHARNVKHDYLMARRLKCRCGMAIRVNYKTRERKVRSYIDRYYECGGKDAVAGSCGLPLFRAEIVEAAVWHWVLELLEDPSAMLAGYRAAQKETDTKASRLKDQLTSLREQLSEHETKLARLLDLYLDGRFPKDVLDERKRQYDDIIARLRIHQGKLEEQLEGTTITDEHIAQVEAFVRDVKALLPNLFDAEFSVKRRLIEALNVRGMLTVEDGAKILYIHWYVTKDRIVLDGSATPSNEGGDEVSINNPATSRCVFNQHKNVVLSWRITLGSSNARQSSAG